MRGSRRRTPGKPSRPLAKQTITRFRTAMTLNGIALDAAQQEAVAALCEPARHGYYLWGEVGRGKSLIADTYFAAIPTPHKRRFHFHDFFRDLQAEIRRERTSFATSLDRLLGDTLAVMFDEFHVHDVADGIYLTSTLQALFDRNTLLITTSNYAREALMPNPYFHETFQATIALINATLNVVNIADGTDYRRRGTNSTQGFASGCWHITTTSARHVDGPEFVAAGHLIRTSYANDEHVTVTFRELCERTLGTEQYLWIAERFTSVSITAVPDPATIGREPLMRFANLVDVLYDRDIQLNVHAADQPSRILAAREPPPDASRTVSRLASLRRPMGATR